APRRPSHPDDHRRGGDDAVMGTHHARAEPVQTTGDPLTLTPLEGPFTQRTVTHHAHLFPGLASHGTACPDPKVSPKGGTILDAGREQAGLLSSTGPSKACTPTVTCPPAQPAAGPCRRRPAAGVRRHGG